MAYQAWQRLPATPATIATKPQTVAAVAAVAAIPNPYCEGLERMRNQRLAHVPIELQTEAARVADGLIEQYGGQMGALGWMAGDLYDCPLVLGTSGESVALDARRAGLAWVITGKARVLAINATGAMIENPNGRFNWRFPRLEASHGAK